MNLKDNAEANAKVILDILESAPNAKYEYLRNDSFTRVFYFDSGNLEIQNTPQLQCVSFRQGNQCNPVPVGMMYWKNIDKIYIHDIYLVFENYDRKVMTVPIIEIYADNYNEEYDCYTISKTIQK